jgi:polysaccharide export outer membrane protein
MNRTLKGTAIIRVFLGFMLISVGAATFLSACSSVGPSATTSLQQVMQKQSLDNDGTKKINDQIFASASSTGQDMSDYVIGEGDLLDVSVFGAPELKSQARVSSSGTVTLPLVGAVELKGLTVRQGERKLDDVYGQKYLRNPHITIFITDQEGGKITLLGAITKPGTYNYYTRQHLLDVLALGGGLSDKAGRTVQVRRPGKDPRHPETIMVDLDQLIQKGHSDLNVPINRGDVVYVPEAGTIYVDGAVRLPGNYAIKRALTAQEAIVNAGGFSPVADQNNIKLVRYLGDGKREVLQLSGSPNGAGDSAGKVDVKDRDVLYVERSALKTFVYSIHFNFAGGLLGIGWSPTQENYYARPNAAAVPQ